MFSAPKLTSIEAEGATALCRLAALAAREFGLELVVAPPPDNDAELVKLEVEVNGVVVALFTPSRVLEPLAQSFFALGADYDIPPALIAPAFEATIAPHLARLEKAAKVKLSVRGVTVAPRTAVSSAASAFRLPSLAAHAYVLAAPPPTLDPAEIPLLSWTAPEPIVIRCPVVFAEAELSPAELAALAPGDVVMLPGRAPADATQVCLAIWPRTGIMARIDGQGLVIAQLGETLMSTNEAAADTRSAAPSKAAAAAPAANGGANAQPVVPPAAIDEIPLRIVFDFGDLDLTVAELKTLVPGQVLNLARDPGNAVRITANGRRIGAGEIVEIDGRLGVRITELAARHERPAS